MDLVYKDLYHEIKKFPDDQKIMIGAAAAFFFVGTAELFLSNIDRYNSALTTQLLKDLYSRKEALREKILATPTFEQYLLKQPDQKPDYTLVGYEKALNEHSKSIAVKYESYNDVRKRLDRYVALSKRAVKSVSKSNIAEEKGYIKIYCEGKERGKYWLASEVKSGAEFAITINGGIDI